VQPGFDSTHRNTDKVLNFSEFIALGVVQQHDKAVFVAELLQCPVETLHFLEALVVERRVLGARKALEAVARERPFLDRVQAPPGEAALLVDEKVIHNATQPGSWLVDIHEIVDFAEGLYKEFLEQVLGFGFAAGQSPGKPVQPVEMGPDDALERVLMLCDDRLLKILIARPAIL